MIGVVECCVQAANPQLPIQPIYAFQNSLQSFRVRGIPKAIGDWRIDKVIVHCNYPDGQMEDIEAVREGCIYVATTSHVCQTAGTSTNGFVVRATGKDEHGNQISGEYICGKADLVISESNETVDAAKPVMHYNISSDAAIGDLSSFDGTLKVWDGEQWIGKEGLTSAEVSSIANDVVDDAVSGHYLPTGEMTYAQRRQELTFGNALPTRSGLTINVDTNDGHLATKLWHDPNDNNAELKIEGDGACRIDVGVGVQGEDVPFVNLYSNEINLMNNGATAGVSIDDTELWMTGKITLGTFNDLSVYTAPYQKTLLSAKIQDMIDASLGPIENILSAING